MPPRPTDSRTAEEIENLRKEAKALKEIRQSMGTSDFATKVFSKVFRDDVDRLRAMEDMWKTRSPPQPLSFDDLQEQSKLVDATVSTTDQRTWSLAEDFVVFKDRFVTTILPCLSVLCES